MDLNEKLEMLRLNIKKLGKLAVAYSGGVDSTFLLKVAHDVLGDKAVAVTAHSVIHSEREIEESVGFVKSLGVKHEIFTPDVLGIKDFVVNPANKCYICKKEVFSTILEIAGKYGITYVADGSNVDDLGDYRPGMAALEELNIISPLREAGMTKEDIRSLSREMGLPTWDKPAFACLASRIPYGQEITKEKLSMVDKAEQFLMDLGFRQVRVRHHGDIARIEVPSPERSRFFNVELMDKVNEKLKQIGFAYISLDLKGYRTGSMNETILKG